jgi:hypothetical protein
MAPEYERTILNMLFGAESGPRKNVSVSNYISLGGRTGVPVYEGIRGLPNLSVEIIVCADWTKSLSLIFQMVHDEDIPGQATFQHLEQCSNVPEFALQIRAGGEFVIVRSGPFRSESNGSFGTTICARVMNRLPILTSPRTKIRTPVVGHIL